MTDREKMLELLDEFKDSIVKLMDERESLDSEAEELRTAKGESEEKGRVAEEQVTKLTTKLEKAEKARDKGKGDLAIAKEESTTLTARTEDAEASKGEAQETLQRERDG